MTSILLIVTALCVAAIVLGRSASRLRPLLLVGAGALTYLAGLIAWWFALYLRIVPLDAVLARFKIDRLDGALGALVYLVPPLVPTATCLIVCAYAVRRPGRRG